MTYPTRQISVSIQCAPSAVYKFVSNPTNMPLWAAGLSQSNMEREGAFWVTDAPMGKVKVRFCEINPFGVLDHDVVLPTGEVNHNPFRVMPNADGSEVVFTLYRLPRMTDQDFDRDSELILHDLLRLKAILEKAL